MNWYSIKIIMVFLSLTVSHCRINTIEIKMEKEMLKITWEDENCCHLLSKMEAVSKLCGIKGIKHRINVWIIQQRRKRTI